MPRYWWEDRRNESFGLRDFPFNPHPFQPPTFGDWWDYARIPGDGRDLVDWHERNIWTGLPPDDHQGREYTAGSYPWPDTDGDGGCGGYYHFNRPVRDGHLRPNQKSRRAFVWPSDGKRKSTWGRWKDIAMGTGPDIFVAPRSQRPTRNHWKNRMQDININEQGEIEAQEDASRAMPWAKRHKDKPYDFKTRTFRRDRPGVWAEAVWPRHEADQYDQPLSYRCRHGDWYNMTWAPFGGVPLPMYSYSRSRKDRKGLWK
jgi:hypothetical protein